MVKEPEIAWKIESIKRQWYDHYYSQNVRILNMSPDEKGILDKAPHVNLLLKYLEKFKLRINIPAPFALILERACGGNEFVAIRIFLRTLSFNHKEIAETILNRKGKYTIAPFDWDRSWQLGPPVYGKEDIPFTRYMNDDLDRYYMYELAGTDGEYVCLLDYKWYWSNYIWNLSEHYNLGHVPTLLNMNGPHEIKVYKRNGPGDYEVIEEARAVEEIRLKEVVGI